MEPPTQKPTDNPGQWIVFLGKNFAVSAFLQPNPTQMYNWLRVNLMLKGNALMD